MFKPVPKEKLKRMRPRNISVTIGLDIYERFHDLKDENEISSNALAVQMIKYCLDELEKPSLTTASHEE